MLAPWVSSCFNLPKRIYTKEELEKGLIKIELVRVVDYPPEVYVFETLKIFTLVEQEEVVEEISKITFVEMTRPPTKLDTSYSLLFIYSNTMLEFSLDHAIGELDLNGKPYNNEKFFPTGYNRELAKLIDKYLQSTD